MYFFSFQDSTISSLCSFCEMSGYERAHSLDRCFGQFHSAELHLQLRQRIYPSFVEWRAGFL